MSHSTEYIESQRCFNKYVRETFRKALHSVKKHTSQPEKILNVGVGPGGNLALFSNIFSETTMHCIDSSKPHIEAAKELHLPLLNLKFYQQNIENELALNTAYNLIWISDVFYPDCVKNPARVLRKLKKFLKPKGRIAIYYNNWTRTKFLPGYPGLESKIHGAILDQYEGEWNGPNNHENMHRWLKQSGYTIVQRKFYSTITASKQEGIQYIERTLMQGEYNRAFQTLLRKNKLTAEEVHTWNNVILPEDKTCIYELPGYRATMQSELCIAKK